MNLAGKHILITGAAKRIGRALAERFLEENIKLTAHHLHSDSEVKSLVSYARQKGRHITIVKADLKDTKAITKAVEKAASELGPIDILINSASIFYPTPALDCTDEQWDDLLSVNLKGQFFFAQAAARTMLGREGVILNLADVNGTRPIKRHAPYCASKAGLLMLTKSLAKEWAPRIRVNSISPGAVLLPEHYTEAQRQSSIEHSLLKRLGNPSDIVEAALFLIENDYITGFDLKVDGGRDLTD